MTRPDPLDEPPAHLRRAKRTSLKERFDINREDLGVVSLGVSDRRCGHCIASPLLVRIGYDPLSDGSPRCTAETCPACGLVNHLSITTPFVAELANPNLTSDYSVPVGCLLARVARYGNITDTLRTGDLSTREAHDAR